MKCEIESEVHSSSVVVGREAPPGALSTADYGVAAYEVIDDETPAWNEIGEDELEVLRIRAGTPRFGREIDDRVLPAEAGLEERAIDFEKGCYPGQEPIARQHYRGRVNRTLRVLELDGSERPEYDAELTFEGKVVGRVTSAAPDGDGVTALAYVRVEVPRRCRAQPERARREAARLAVPAPVAQGIERCPAEAEAASSNLAGRMATSWSAGSVHGRAVAGGGGTRKTRAHHRLGGLGALRVPCHGCEELLPVECVEDGVRACRDAGGAGRVAQEGDLAEVATRADSEITIPSCETSRSPSATM